MTVSVLDPLEDKRWHDFVVAHRDASVFHQLGWLKALARTYGYHPLVITTSGANQPLENGMVMCQVASWLTGSRLVSLPFSDHCAPLVGNCAQVEEFARWMREACERNHYRYAECRPLTDSWSQIPGLQASSNYWFHEFDLEPDLERIFGGLHKNSFQRKIQRAQREGISYEAGRTQNLLDEFSVLLRVTRKRHQLLPQPRAWFESLLECLGDNLQIRVARKDGKAIAAVLTLRHGATVIYKYGCSDERLHRLGAMPFLMWKLIEEAKTSGARKIDFGRTAQDNVGLTVFKDRLGAIRRPLTYYRFARRGRANPASLSDSRALRNLLRALPESLRDTAGRILYKHMA